jgi:hypothetical protein
MATDTILADALRDLMEALEVIGQGHEELYDTEVRERMSDAVRRAFLKPEPGFTIPGEFGMFDDASNAAIGRAIAAYVAKANARAAEIGLLNPSDRLDAFQDAAVCTRGESQYPDNFFGWAESI